MSDPVFADPQGWTQVWSDEFDGTAVDSTKWRNEVWTSPYNNEQQAYVPQQATVGDGMLTITATNQSLRWQALPLSSIGEQIL